MRAEVKLKKFQKINKQSDVMGVIRTLFPNIEFTISKKDKKNEVSY